MVDSKKKILHHHSAAEVIEELRSALFLSRTTRIVTLSVVDFPRA